MKERKTMVSRLGIQSWCFRGFDDLNKVIELLKECDVNKVELSGVHFDPVKAPADSESVVKKFSDSGLQITSFGVQPFNADEAAARKAFDFAKTAGFSAIGADLSGDGLKVVEKLCKEYNKRIAIHNHGRNHQFGSVTALKKLFAESSPNIGLCLDTAWALDAGEDPIEMAAVFKDRLYGVHIKDFVFDSQNKPRDVVVGTGGLNMDKLAEFLVANGFDGFLTLEYEGDVDNPVPALKKCVQAIRNSFQKVQ